MSVMHLFKMLIFGQNMLITVFHFKFSWVEGVYNFL